MQKTIREEAMEQLTITLPDEIAVQLKAAAQAYVDTEAVVREGWEILVKNLGLLKATQFVILLERGKGDSVKEIAEYWGDATIEEIHNRVIKWQSQQSRKHKSTNSSL